MTKLRKYVGILVLGVVTALAAAGRGAEQPEITDAGRIGETIAIENLVIRDGVVTGTLANRRGRTLREVKLLIRYAWLWNNERAPQRDNPGRSDYATIPGEIAPHGSLPFVYRPEPPLPGRTDGRFDPTVQVVGFTEVGE